MSHKNLLQEAATNIHRQVPTAEVPWSTSELTSRTRPAVLASPMVRHAAKPKKKKGPAAAAAAAAAAASAAPAPSEKPEFFQQVSLARDR